MRGIDLVAAAVSLTMNSIYTNTENKKGSKRCLDYLAEKGVAIPREYEVNYTFFLADFSAALASAAAAFFSAVLAAPSPVALATALVPNF